MEPSEAEFHPGDVEMSREKRRRVCKWGKQWAKDLHGSHDAESQLTLTLPV